jgi:hypothetical protein
VLTHFSAVILPKQEAAAERKRIVPSTAARREFFQLLSIAAAYDDVVKFKRADEASNYLLETDAPLLDA